uniref:Uncharacterized protein n=1 Tax=Mola mola TaxID=94237 RepID=A0A3Q3WV34_MOLML
MLIKFSWLLLQLAGLTLLALGIWVSVDEASFLQLLGPFSSQDMQFVNIGSFCISIGAVLVLLGLLGSCGAHKESKCLLLMFFSVLLIIFIAGVAVGVVALAYSSFAEGILRAWATPTLQKDYGSDPVATKLWNTTMTEQKCCGFDNYTDFVGSKFEEDNGGSMPPSCCWTSSSPCSLGEAERKNKICPFSFPQITAMIVAMYLYCHLDNRIN